MSDDDCDIFNLPTKQINVVPQELYVEEQNTSQTYDFIETSIAGKKSTKVGKTKRTAKSGQQQKQTNKQKEEEANNNEAAAAAASPEAESELMLSKLISEMEERQAKNMDALPVARRTRRSLGKKKESEDVVVLAKQSPPKKQRGRGRKKAAEPPAASTTTTTTVQTQLVNAGNPSVLNININIGSAANQRVLKERINEIGARAKVIDAIDLVSAVMPRVEGFINLDSDDEADQLLAQVKEPTPENNFDEDNPILDINLNWHGEIQFYKLRQHQKFAHMFKEVAKRNNVPINDIIINMDDKFISQTESPENVGLKVFHILSGCAMESNNKVTEHKKDENTLIKPKKFQLKVQGDKWKHPLIIQLKKTDAFKILYIKCAEEMECDVRDFKLFFDGELLEPDDTPTDQDMEGNEVIDLRMK